jgi:DMSO/TMAO reductase YedYZ molybdopterin-dependent catalytic subunit
MTTPRVSWGTAGVIAGLAGLAVSHAATRMLGVRLTPMEAVAELVIRNTPGDVAHWVIDLIGKKDKPLLLVLVTLGMLAFMLAAGRLAENRWWAPILVYLLMGGVALFAVYSGDDRRGLAAVPVVAGVVTWIVVLSFLTEPMHREAAEPPGSPENAQTRRGLLIRAGFVGVAAAGTAIAGDFLGRRRKHVEESRRLLNLPITDREVPAKVRVGADGITKWKTSSSSFYQIDTLIVVPAIEPKDWSLRIHGMVENELVLSFQDLLDRELTEDWITLNCVSNPVGGDLIGNAWWSGVRIAPLLEETGVDPAADAVLQTSDDGWTCGTPLAALTDDRNAMIAIGMNGEPLPLEHGFPARMIVPGLYGYVSACKWLVDIEVTKFNEIEAFWTSRGWSEQGPVKIASRIDVPGHGDDLAVGSARVGGMAWSQHTGIQGVEFALDGGAWTRAEIGGITQHHGDGSNEDTWVQWAATVVLEDGDHELRVRAIGKDGQVQTGVEQEPPPDGAQGWHSVEFSAS